MRTTSQTLTHKQPAHLWVHPSRTAHPPTGPGIRRHSGSRETSVHDSEGTCRDATTVDPWQINNCPGLTSTTANARGKHHVTTTMLGMQARVHIPRSRKLLLLRLPIRRLRHSHQSERGLRSCRVHDVPPNTTPYAGTGNCGARGTGGQQWQSRLKT